MAEVTTVIRIEPTRSRDVPEGHYADEAKGILMVDRYSADKAMAQVRSGVVILVFCWAHVRRDFIGKRLKRQVTNRMGVDVTAYFKQIAEEAGVHCQNLIVLYLNDYIQSCRKLQWRA